MSRQRIEIERLAIRLKGVAPESARAAVGDLGRELLGELARQRAHAVVGAGSLRHVDAGTVQLASGATPSDVRRTIAGSIAVAINTPHTL